MLEFGAFGAGIIPKLEMVALSALYSRDINVATRDVIQSFCAKLCNFNGTYRDYLREAGLVEATVSCANGQLRHSAEDIVDVVDAAIFGSALGLLNVLVIQNPPNVKLVRAAGLSVLFNLVPQQSVRRYVIPTLVSMVVLDEQYSEDGVASFVQLTHRSCNSGNLDEVHDLLVALRSILSQSVCAQRAFSVHGGTLAIVEVFRCLHGKFGAEEAAISDSVSISLPFRVLQAVFGVLLGS